MKDLRLIKFKERQSMDFGLKEIITTIVGGGILFIIGMFTYSKIGTSVESSMLDGGVYINTSHYCAGGTWNGSLCTGTLTTGVPTGVDTLRDSVKPNITSGMDLGSVSLIVLAAAGIIGILYMAFR